MFCGSVRLLPQKFTFGLEQEGPFGDDGHGVGWITWLSLYNETVLPKLLLIIIILML